MELGDEYSEWDRFFDVYEEAPTADEAFERYKKQRRLEERRRNAMSRTSWKASQSAQPGSACGQSTKG